MDLRRWLKLLVPRYLVAYYHKIHLLLMISAVERNHRRCLKIVRNKDQLTVVFFVVNASLWKYHTLYEEFEAARRFSPIIVICPNIVNGGDNMFREMKAAYDFFKSKGYSVVKTYDEANDQWLDVKRVITPDLIFFTSPHNFTTREYLIGNWNKTLTCYVPYGIMCSSLHKMQYNQIFHNLLWKAFYETGFHMDLARKHALNKGRNVVHSGYPFADIFLSKDYNAKNVWKLKDRDIKRIIWAPHYTISSETLLQFSTFLQFSELMLNFLERYPGRIQIAFKPHPRLKEKLYQYSDWGKNKTDSYYRKWDEHENGMLCEGEYHDLFLGSDALIHDSGSFIVEYLYVNKPVLFCLKDEKVYDSLNDFGKIALKHHYLARSPGDIISFIDMILQFNIDEKRQLRENFIRGYLYPPNAKSATQNVVDEILKAIG